ncbi:DotD/TraH family lipoprotein [Brucella pituitosa]|uniref:DotD/TraH family lipoprotein n=1 Tax=Brucella pituitosa TaxID=571256 RepID=UPI0009A20938|nr:DotD/TraH family lipoprotein [Brucella pituitosa]
MIVLLLPTGCFSPAPVQSGSVSLLINKMSGQVKRQTAFVYLDPSAFNLRPFGVIQQISLNGARAPLNDPMHACFQGTIETLLAAIAAKTGYQWGFTGTPPPAPILVSVNRDSTSAYAILEEGLLQAQGLVTLKIDPANKRMTLRYSRRGPRIIAHLDETRF